MDVCRHSIIQTTEEPAYWRICTSPGFLTVASQSARSRLKSPASRLFTQPFIQAQSKKTSKLLLTGLCDVYSPVSGEFPAQRATNAEKVAIWWRHHVSFDSSPFIIQMDPYISTHIEAETKLPLTTFPNAFSWMKLYEFAQDFTEVRSERRN